jgi:hypothetical protein
MLQRIECRQSIFVDPHPDSKRQLSQTRHEGQNPGCRIRVDSGLLLKSYLSGWCRTGTGDFYTFLPQQKATGLKPKAAAIVDPSLACLRFSLYTDQPQQAGSEEPDSGGDRRYSGSHVESVNVELFNPGCG